MSYESKLYPEDGHKFEGYEDKCSKKMRGNIIKVRSNNIFRRYAKKHIAHD